MEYRESERQYHTRLGWWVMTHERGAMILIGLGALLVLALDLVVIAVRWDSFSPLSFAVAFISLPVIGFGARLFGVGGPVGTDRVEARRRARMLKVVFLAIVVVAIGGSGLASLSRLSFLSGLIAGLAVLFIVMAVRSLAMLRRVRSPEVPTPPTRSLDDDELG